MVAIGIKRPNVVVVLVIEHCVSDGISAEHGIHSDRRIIILLSTFYNRVITHGQLPDGVMTIIIPLATINVVA